MRATWVLSISLVCGCAASSTDPPTASDAARHNGASDSDDPGSDSIFGVEDVMPDSGSALDSAPTPDDTSVEPDVATDTFMPPPPPPPPPPCTTKISYGASWIHPPGHPDSFDVVTGSVTWGGGCTQSGAQSFALLSNGFKPFFNGPFSCTIALDDGCSPSACRTRVTYGPAWIHGASHPAQYDDTAGHVTWDGICHAASPNSYAVLSNGWKPYFNGISGCAFSLEYVGCGGI